MCQRLIFLEACEQRRAGAGILAQAKYQLENCGSLPHPSVPEALTGRPQNP